jgi:hypothetical protein
MTPTKLLTWFAAEASRDGYTVPQLDSAQALHVATVALDKLGAATGLTRPQPAQQPAITAGPVDSVTQLLPIVGATPRGWSR